MLDLKYFLEFQIVQGSNSTPDGQVGICLFLTLLYTLPLKKYGVEWCTVCSKFRI